MPPSKTTFVTACQQMLALGVVLAALTPAASVVSLDVVREMPTGSLSPESTDGLSADLSAYTREATRTSRVPTSTVDPTVTEYSLTAPSGAQAGREARRKTAPSALDVSRRSKVGALGGPEVTSLPEPVTGYGAVGLTWAHGVEVEEDAVGFAVRTRTGDTWSEWMDLDYHDDHAPDPGTEEARHARPGTDPLLVGDVDQVQVRAAATDALPADLRLAVVDPGVATRTVAAKPALDTDTMDDSSVSDLTTDDGATDPPVEEPTPELPTEPGEGTDGGDEIDLQAATYTPRPQIYSRAQWGADERMRDKSSLSYFEVHAGFVHHTVNANDYSRDEVPGIIRSIYAYHTQSRGWSDIGYNFLVDRFGRIWEGRYGGIDRPVVGAHTLNYNDYSFAMSAIGNYDIKQPSQAMIQAYGALFAWKLSLHGVDASSTVQRVGSKNFQAINGHRDAASTACPGRYLFAKIPQIRTLAAEAQRGWAGRELESNLASTPHPDLIVRRASDGQGFVIPTAGLTGFGKGITALSGLTSGDSVVASADLTGDGIGDLVVRTADGGAEIRPGAADGTFGAAAKKVGALEGHDLITPAGDLDGDGLADLVARWPATGRLDVYLGRGDGTFRVERQGATWGDYTLLVGAGDADGDGRADLLARDASGAMWRLPVLAKGGFGSRVAVTGSWQRWTTVSGAGDLTRDGRPDLFVRDADSKNGYVLPSRGDGSYGLPLGPVTRVKSAGSVLGAAQILGDATADVVARKGGAVLVYPNSGGTETAKPIATGVDLSDANLLLNAGDWDRDGFGDIVYRSKTSGALYLRRGDGTGRFGTSSLKLADGFKSVGLLAAVGDMTGDGYPDLMGQPTGGAIRIYPGNGVAGFRTSYVAHERITAGRQVPVGRWDADGAPDSLFRKGTKLLLFPGNGPGGLTSPRTLSVDLAPYDWVIGVSDVLLTGHSDLIVRDKATKYLWLLQGTTTGFTPRRFLAEGMGVYDLAG